MADDTLRATDHQREVALFRHAVIGPLLGRDFDHGELREALRALAAERRRPPDSKNTRRYGVSTIERWYYAYRCDGFEGLLPGRRSDRGRGRMLTDEQRQLLLDIRHEHPRASAPLILRTLVAQGVLEPGALSAATLNRFYADHGKPRARRKDKPGQRRERRRWSVARPGLLWHADVCHGPKLASTGAAMKVHAIVDDHSRYVVALDVYETEQEVDMLDLFGRAVIRHGRPEALYLDNGGTYIGKALATACLRLGSGLRHAYARDAEARGKMERFWGTLKGQCMDFIAPGGTVHDARVRLQAWLDTHYHRTPHGGVMGATPEAAFGRIDSACEPVDDEQLTAAFEVRTRRRVRKDGTLDVAGSTLEVEAGFLAGKNVTLVTYMPPVDIEHAPFIDHEGRHIGLAPVDPVANSRRRRRELPPPKPAPQTGFNPAQTCLDIATGRLPGKEDAS